MGGPRQGWEHAGAIKQGCVEPRTAGGGAEVSIMTLPTCTFLKLARERGGQLDGVCTWPEGS